MDLALVIAISTMGGLGLLFAAFLAVADKKLKVEENPLIEKVNEVLPGANCGACGCAGCYAFAVKVVGGGIKVNGCPVGGEEVANKIAELLGVTAEASVKMVARVMCRGGNAEAAKKKAEYTGPIGCAVAHLMSGGNKACYYGCLGGGDCVRACPFDAMYMNDNGLPEVIDEKCTGCGNCVRACPRGIMELHPIDRNTFIFCKSQDDPKTSRAVCKVSCIACGICARKSEGTIEVINNLAVIDYNKYNETIEALIPFDKCPTKAIDRLFIKKLEEVKAE